MKLALTDTQWRDIQVCLLIGISHTQKSSSIKFEENALIQRYLKTHDEIEKYRKKQK